MIKRLIYIGTFLLLGLWAWPAQASGTPYPGYGYYPYYDPIGYQIYSQHLPYASGYYPSAANPIYGWAYTPGLGFWWGVRNMDGYPSVGGYPGYQSNPMGNWYGVNNTGSYPMQSYPPMTYPQQNYPPAQSYPPQNYQQPPQQNYQYPPSSQTMHQAPYPMTHLQSVISTPDQVAYANTTTTTNPYFVAPKTGVAKYSPFLFAGLLTATVFIIRKRKWIFS